MTGKFADLCVGLRVSFWRKSFIAHIFRKARESPRRCGREIQRSETHRSRQNAEPRESIAGREKIRAARRQWRGPNFLATGGFQTPPKPQMSRKAEPETVSLGLACFNSAFKVGRCLSNHDNRSHRERATLLAGAVAATRVQSRSNSTSTGAHRRLVARCFSEAARRGRPLPAQALARASADPYIVMKNHSLPKMRISCAIHRPRLFDSATTCRRIS